MVLLAGTNDLEEKEGPPVIAGNIKLILAALKAHRADLPVVLCKVFPSAASKSRSAAQIQALNEQYAALVKDQPQVTLLDTSAWPAPSWTTRWSCWPRTASPPWA